MVAILQLLGGVEEVTTLVVIWSLDPILLGLPVTILCLWIGVRIETRS